MDQSLTKNQLTARLSSCLATYMMESDVAHFSPSLSAGVQCTGLPLVLDRDCRSAPRGNLHGQDPDRRAIAHQDGRLRPLLQN